MLILASRSPRRAELLRLAGIPFRVQAADVDESVHDNESAEDYVRRVSEMKALAVPLEGDEVVLGADTVVTIHNQILGKPRDTADAMRMLEMLSGRAHEVITGICLRDSGRVLTDWAVTKVWFSQIRSEEIAEYVDSGEPMDKAGAYAIQGRASRYIDRIDGSYTNVVGLPIALVHRALRAMGHPA